MNCESTRSRLSWLLDGELRAPEAESIRAHAASCPSCGALLAEMKACDEDIRAALAACRPSPEFAGRVAKAARRSFSWKRVAAAVAAVFFIGLALSFVYVNTREPSPLSVSLLGSPAFHADSMGALRLFVFNGATEQPLKDALVRLSLAERPVGEFRTNAAGSIDGSFHVPDLADGSYPMRLEIASPIGGDVLSREVTVRREYRLLLTTDKPLYQPGQVVHLRTLALNAFTLKPRMGEAQLEVSDSRGNRVFSKKTELSGFGIASADFALADEVNLGTYKATVAASGVREERTFEVARYALPKFKVELEQARGSYRPGDRVRATVRAKYFFGKPVQGRVRATLAREVASGDLRPDGTWEFEVPAPGEGTYSAEVTVTDSADHKETKAAQVVVSREPLQVVCYPEGGSVLWSAQNTYFVIVSSPDGRPAPATLRLLVNGTEQSFETDELGVATVPVNGTDIRLVWARDQAGNQTRTMDRLGDNSPAEFVIRLDRPTYRGGETMNVKVVGQPGGAVYVDVVKDGQLLVSKVADKGSVAFDLPPDLFGTLQVAAYTRRSATPVVRLAYVNLPDGLKIRPLAAKEMFRPGEEMSVSFEVLDKQDKPIQAALGISVVDEALFGLAESKIASEKAWLSLAPELIDTRGFLKTDAAAIYQGNARNAQRFVSGNGRAQAQTTLIADPYADREREIRHFIMRGNDVIGHLFIAGLSVLLLALLIMAIGYLRKRLLEEKISWVTSLLVVVGTAYLLMLIFWPPALYLKRSSAAYDDAEPMEAVPVTVPRASVGDEPRAEGPFGGRARPSAPLLEAMSRGESSSVQSNPSKPIMSWNSLAAPPQQPRIREYFPETLYWLPQLITDERGRARVTLPAADSITSWRLLANAVARTGALGYGQANLKVFQDFFVDIDFPVALTKGDSLHVPVAIYNYLQEPQKVSVRLQRETWFEGLDDEAKSIDLKPGEVSAVYFGIKVKEHGRKTLTVFADGKQQDAIRRSVDVMEKGREIPISVSERVSGRRAFKVEIPARAIEGASVVFVRMTPGVSDLVTGLEGMIRMPSGCFEQTLSSAYPNLAIHAYLQETGQLTRDAEDRLRAAHSVAVQKLLSFENPSGGFGWYPGREANLVLTAYGTMFLADLAKVYDFDHRVLDRAIAWLEARQDPAGSWTGQDHGSTWSRLSNAATPSTAWVVWALRRAGRASPAVARAEEFLTRFDENDGYAAALIANAFPTKQNLDRLARLAKDGRWTTRVQTWTRAGDVAADLEATALAVIALANHAPGLADEGAAWIVKARDAWGTWGSTQATVLALKALASTGGGGARDKVGAKLAVNGKEVPNAFTDSDAAQSFDISPYMTSGANEIVLETSRRVNVQVAGRYFVPWGTEDLIRDADALKFKVNYDRTEVKVGDTLTCTVTVEADAFAMMAEVAIPPGFTIDSSGFDDLVNRRVIDRYAQNGRTLIFYLPGKGATFSYVLKPRYPMKVVVPRSVSYEYYMPDRRVIVPPQEILVNER